MSELAGLTRVAYEAVGLADFQADNQRAEASYRESVGGMSDAAIKHELALDRQRRALQKGPHAYRELARAELQVRNSERALRGETDALTRSQDRNQRGLGGLRRSVVGLAAAYVGTQGIINLVRGSVNAAREEELVLGQTRVALDATGAAYDQYGEKLDRTIARVQRLGFDDEELAKSFQTLARSADDPIEAMEQLDLVADLVRGRYIDVAAATQIVNKANLDMAGGIRRLGIDVEKNAKSTELLAALTSSYGKAAEEAANSGVAAADRFAVASEEAQEAIGRGLAPAVTDLSERITDWLSKAENQEELQRRVNEAVEVGEVVVRGLGEAFDFLDATIIGPLKSLGLLEEAVTAALVYGLIRKSGLAAISIGAIRAASRRTTVAVVADNAIMARSYDGVAAAAGRAATAAGTVGVRGGRVVSSGGRRGIPPVLLGNPAIAATGAVIISAGGGTQRGDRSSQYPTVYQVVSLAAAGQASAAQVAILQQELGGYSLANAPDANMRRAERRLQRVADGGRAGRGRTDHAPRGDLRDRDAGGDTGDSPRGSFTFNRFTAMMASLDEEGLDAEATPGTGDDLRNERAKLALARRALRELELTRDQRMAVKNARNAALRAIAAIEQAEEQEAARINDERDRRRQERERKERERLERILEQAEKVAKERGELLAGTGGNRQNMRRQALKHVDEVVAGVKAKGQTEAEAARDLQRQVQSAQFEFLQSLQGVMNQFGGNLFGALPGADPRVYTELKEQTDVLRALASGVRTPGTSSVKNEIDAAFVGASF